MNFTKPLLPENLPKKSLFNTSEVASLVTIKPHEIRQWESEFPQIKPQKNKHGQRLYRKEDLILFSAIKHLLQEKKFTVAGALKIIADSDIFENMVQNTPEPASIAYDAKEAKEALQASAALLPELESSFDEQTHEIYQHCAEDLEQALAVKPEYVGDMIADALLSEQKAQKDKSSRLSKLEYEKALAMLIASKTQLNDVLSSLDKFAPNNFWEGSHKKD